jgi:pimeloyl-ACP methyl ester carboxylesterase
VTDTIHYHDDGKGFPIVWIHGFPLSSAMFERQLTIDHYRHIRPDLRGFGKTKPADGAMTMRDYARDVIDVLDKEKIDRAVIAGFSMGGYVAMQILRDVPQRVAALILIDTRETPDTEEARAGRKKSADDVRANGIKSVVDAMLPKMIVNETLSDDVRKIMESSTPEGVIAALGAMADRPDSTDTLRNATVPALIFVGDKDPITPPTDAERMGALMSEAELAPIANAAHLANYERPDQVNHIIEAWLERKLSGLR